MKVFEVRHDPSGHTFTVVHRPRNLEILDVSCVLAARFNFRSISICGVLETHHHVVLVLAVDVSKTNAVCNLSKRVTALAATVTRRLA